MSFESILSVVCSTCVWNKAFLTCSCRECD